jgi:hypothetical protein
MQIKTEQYKSKLVFESKSVYAEKAYKILESIMVFDLHVEVNPINLIHFYSGDPRYIVEIEDFRSYCLVKFLICTPLEVEYDIKKSMLANEEAFFNLIDELGLVGDTFLFDGKNMAPISFEDFEMDTEREVHNNEIFITNKSVGLIKTTDSVFVLGTASKVEAFDLSVFSLYNRLPYLQTPKKSPTFVGCLLSATVSGLLSSVKIEEIEDVINTELNHVELTQYVDAKLGKLVAHNIFMDRMIGSLKLNKLKEIINEPKDFTVDAEIVMKDGEIAFISRIMEMGLNRFLTKLPNNDKVTEVEIDVPNIGAKRMFLRRGAAFIVPENHETYKDLGYWISLLNSDNVCFVMT